MAVPPIQRFPHQSVTGPAESVRFPWLLDTVLALLVVAALPLAIVSIPNTVSIVGDLLPDGFDRLGLMRAHGLALPAMMLTVPLAAVALARVRAPHLVIAGLLLLALADASGGYAASTFIVGVMRVLHGIGAGLLVPATLVAVWERPRLLRALWAGVLALSLLGAQALALWPLDGVNDWKVTLQPYPLVSGVALALAAAYLVAWLLRGRQAAPRPEPRERNRLLLAAVPATGIAAAAISTASQDWQAQLVILVAALAIVALLALASAGTAHGRTPACTMVAVGVVLLPSIAQVTFIEMGGLGGPGLKGLWIPFGVAGLLAVAAAVLVCLFAADGGRWLTSLGLLAMVLGLSSVRVVVPDPDGLVLVVPFALLAVGAAVALTAALREAGLGAALFGVALCFPGVLAGYLLGTGVQMALLQGVRSPQELVDRFVGALHLWALIGGFLVVAIIVLVALLARRAATAEGAGPRPGVGGGPAAPADPVGQGGSAPVGGGRDATTEPAPGAAEEPALGAAGDPAAGAAEEPAAGAADDSAHGAADGGAVAGVADAGVRRNAADVGQREAEAGQAGEEQADAHAREGSGSSGEDTGPVPRVPSGPPPMPPGAAPEGQPGPRADPSPRPDPSRPKDSSGSPVPPVPPVPAVPPVPPVPPQAGSPEDSGTP